ncbi:MAG: tripartite tricarboxylate transporter substrate binding protein [Gammaproteobacteria bacterium]|nr:tripartite tricarboxylate transporter substrate binding protein [Gammaproteobacteria bacterium]MBU1442876.1 tripartite tricarboxylate transporter substrate binding protein [Gammaproteobacteria bacterium]MBU2288932.1 tripartite tricarboxylate transporter substrate binding protein [Gammaproteobacteria bacterium]MBU2407064.1 tripartite tricarboxylate transporter substrate binding protein [Gammaproteobacteria bacterium]
MNVRIPRRRAATIVAAALLSALAAPTVAQTFPDRPIRMIVGYSAGGGVDAMARLLAPRLSTLLGQQVVVDNRAGAAGVIAGDAVAKAAPDGYTLLLGDSSTLIAKFMQPKLSFDPIRSFSPVAGLFKSPLMIIANNEFPAKTPRELVSAMKAKPGFYSFATSGVGTVHHLGFEMLKGQSGTFALHIPYRGAAQIVPDVISGQVPLGVVSATAGLAQARAGKVRGLAMMSNDKLPGAEDIAPLSSAVPGLDVAPHLFLLAPAGTPAPVIDRLEDAVRTVMKAPDLPQAAALQGAVPDFKSSQDLARSMAEESQRWGKLIAEQKITAQ